MNIAPQQVGRNRLVALPSEGDRVCLLGAFDFTDRHTHGTVRGFAVEDGRVLAIVEWDDDPGADFDRAPIPALDRKCLAREERTPHLPPRCFGDRFPKR